VRLGLRRSDWNDINRVHRSKKTRSPRVSITQIATRCQRAAARRLQRARTIFPAVDDVYCQSMVPRLSPAACLRR